MKGRLFAEDGSDKTPTAGTVLSRAQEQRPSSSTFAHASIRRSLQPSEPALTLPPGPSTSGPFIPGHSASSVRQLHHFPSIEEAGANSSSPHGVAAREVWGWFQDHLDSLLESVRLFRFDQFEMHIRSFWSNLQGTHREVVHAPAIAGLMAKADAVVYDVRASILQCGSERSTHSVFATCRKFSRFYAPRCSRLSRQIRSLRSVSLPKRWRTYW